MRDASIKTFGTWAEKRLTCLDVSSFRIRPDSIFLGPNDCWHAGRVATIIGTGKPTWPSGHTPAGARTSKLPFGTSLPPASGNRANAAVHALRDQRQQRPITGPTSDPHERQLADQQAGVAIENVTRQVWVGSRYSKFPSQSSSGPAQIDTSFECISC